MSGEFVDTNILVYAHDTSAGEKQNAAIELILRLGREQHGVLSVQVLLEFLATVTRKLERPMQLSSAIEVVEDFATWRVFAPSAYDVGTAARVAQRYAISIWDAMIVHAASASQATVLWTEDLNHGQSYEGVPVLNPFRV